MELSKEIAVESWVSSNNQNEIHFYLEDGTTYLFGFNPKIISRSKVGSFLEEIGFKTDPKEWVDQ